MVVGTNAVAHRGAQRQGGRERGVDDRRRRVVRASAPVRRLPDVVLATDLDGTFVAGSESARAELYALCEALRGRLALIYVTGRDVPHVMRLCAQGLPRPDYVVADVGTTVARGDGAPLASVQRWIDERWGADAHARIRAMLDGTPGLEPISAHFQRRLSYVIDPARFDARVLEQVELAGWDCYMQSTRFLDIMPRGVTKGSTLQRLLAVAGFDRETVLVAGDTLNDASLFATGCDGVVVGNAEAALRLQTRGMPHVLQSAREGAAAVLEALQLKLAALDLDPRHELAARVLPWFGMAANLDLDPELTLYDAVPR